MAAAAVRLGATDADAATQAEFNQHTGVRFMGAGASSSAHTPVVGDGGDQCVAPDWMLQERAVLCDTDPVHGNGGTSGITKSWKRGVMSWLYGGAGGARGGARHLSFGSASGARVTQSPSAATRESARASVHVPTSDNTYTTTARTWERPLLHVA